MTKPSWLAALTLFTLLSSGVCGYAQRVYTLEEIFKSADDANLTIKTYTTGMEEGRKEIEEARSNYLPDINTSLSLSYIGDGFTTRRNYSDYQKAPIPHLGTGLSLSVEQPVYTGGALSSSVKLAELKSVTRSLELENVTDNLHFQLTDFYLNLYKYHNLKKVIESNIISAKKILQEMSDRYDEGTVLRNDITRYELLVSNLELELIRITNTLEILNENLVTLSGLPANTIVTPDSTILNRSLPATGEDLWQNEASINSPAIKMAVNGVNISRMYERMTKAERLPKIGLQAKWTMDGPILVEIPPINRNLSYWYVGVGVTYNISSLYKTNKSLARCRIATQKAGEYLEDLREKVSLSVSADYIRYMESYEQLKTLQKSVELAERNYHTIATRYSEGMALITDMLDAADARLNAQQRLVNGRIEIIYNYYKLLFTSGQI